mmetsp:Transcript_75132/g.199518  ORF Transcript_75132/g.199518 Transcript_75132/m.199518 type:complete len:505 (-) Transcript_75132:1324-2838(-)
MRRHALLQVLQHVAGHEDGQLPVLDGHVRLDEALDHGQGDRHDFRDEDVRVVVHQGSNHLARRYPQAVLVIVVLVGAPVVLLDLLLPRLGLRDLLRFAALEGVGEGLDGDLADVLQLLRRQNTRASLLEALCHAVGTGLQGTHVDRLLAAALQLGQDAREELVDQLAEDLSLQLGAVARGVAELTPGLEGHVADLFRHGEVEDGQERLSSLRHIRRVALAQLLHEGVHALEGIPQVLHGRGAHDHDLDLAVLVRQQGEVHLLVVVNGVPRRLVELPRGKLELLEDAGQDVGHEGQEVRLHRPADALRSLQHVLLDGVAGGQVRHRRRRSHGLHDALSVRAEARRASGLCQQGDALEGLAQEGSLLGVVQNGRDQLLEHGHQLPIVRREAILHLPGDDRDERHRMPLDGQDVRLQLLPKLLHDRLHEGLEDLALHFLPVQLEGLHAASDHALAGVVERGQEVGQQLLRERLGRHEVGVVLGKLGHRAPSGVLDPRVRALQVDLDA